MSKPTIWENIVRMSDHTDNEWPVEWRVSADAAIDRVLLRDKADNASVCTSPQCAAPTPEVVVARCTCYDRTSCEEKG